MAIESIYCPACNNKLRVPDELMGQQVQCPKCQAMFTAPPPPPAPTAMSTDRPGAPPQRMPADSDDLGYDDDRWDYERRRRTGPNPVPPGVCMIVVSILGLLVNTFDIVLMGFFPQEFKKMLANNPLIAAGGGAPGGADFTTIKLAGSAICLFISFVILAGGISMMRRRLWGLSIAACFLAIFNLNEFCCVLGLPVAIWGLIVLFNEETKRSFS